MNDNPILNALAVRLIREAMQGDEFYQKEVGAEINGHLVEGWGSDARSLSYKYSVLSIPSIMKWCPEILTLSPGSLVGIMDITLDDDGHPVPIALDLESQHQTSQKVDSDETREARLNILINMNRRRYDCVPTEEERRLLADSPRCIEVCIADEGLMHDLMHTITFKSL